MPEVTATKPAGFLARLRRSQRGIAMSEFALAAPMLAGLGLYGLETANLAIAHLRISQIASNLADTTSRIGESSPTALKKIRESDIDDAFEAVRLQSGAYDVTTHGRVILSSLEQNSSKPAGQWIHWQRCIGKKNVASSYGVAGAGATGTAFPGMGVAGKEITAPAAGAVMFVEIIYDYQPLISETFLGPKQIRAKAAFLVRDRRDLSNANNPANTSSSAQTCNKFNA